MKYLTLIGNHLDGNTIAAARLYPFDIKSSAD